MLTHSVSFLSQILKVAILPFALLLLYVILCDISRLLKQNRSDYLDLFPLDTTVVMRLFNC